MSNGRPNLLREVERMVLLLENGEWTDTMPKHQLAQRLEAALHDLHDELRGDDSATLADQDADTPRTDALTAQWADDGSSRGAAYMEMRDLARRLETEVHSALARVGAVRDQAEFTAWLEQQMPPGTIISNPAWWAPRIIRALKGTPAAAVADRDEADDLEDAAIRAMKAKRANPQPSTNPGQVADAQPVFTVHTVSPVPSLDPNERRTMVVGVVNTSVVVPLVKLYAEPPRAQAQPIRLQHMAVADEDGLRWMAGRKMPAGVESIELYAMPDYGSAPGLLYAAQPSAQAQPSGNAGELERDAGRYRWIADNAEVVFDKPVKFQQSLNYQAFTRIPDRPYLSRAIDAAIAASKGANHG